jgi:hypothetical protein
VQGDCCYLVVAFKRCVLKHEPQFGCLAAPSIKVNINEDSILGNAFDRRNQSPIFAVSVSGSKATEKKGFCYSD